MLFAATSDLFAFLQKITVFQEDQRFVCSLHLLNLYRVKSSLLL